ncbi:MAG: peptidase M23 family protein [Candidatus Peregrinibacteria bacterium GW2011_GWE2_39_6]|nr:MAG: peptidase M23 family protein [Candidatus Peregrinibacteria bacterium GW2011_GWF2_39_17]KKR25682.1 MAG: peptidase M23 family protein [Candidatus Peregrinibacteria bacterium GW2011_GWE2_39_6]
MLLLVNSLNLSGSYRDAGGAYVEALGTDLNPEEVTLVDDGGYLVKVSPIVTDSPRYLNRKEEIVHEVQAGETLSKIAYIYDLNQNTIYWANQGKIRNINSLKVGQQLTIPVASGYKIKVAKGDTLASLVKKYKGNEDSTKAIAWNNLPENGIIEIGQEILIADGQPYITPIIAANSGGSGGKTVVPPPISVAPSPGGAGWMKPTSGTITQWHHAGHYAIDIANKLNTPIMAAAAGTVIKAAHGWNGGYGNEIIIQHDNGCTTLYGHSNELYVTEGQYVDAGQVISGMGNTGRVYGRTGIHLHVELRCDGVKINPKILFGL